MVKFLDESSELDRLKAVNAELLRALQQIKEIGGWEGQYDGTCPYGCTCPGIAMKAIAKATNQEVGQ